MSRLGVDRHWRRWADIIDPMALWRAELGSLLDLHQVGIGRIT